MPDFKTVPESEWVNDRKQKQYQRFEGIAQKVLAGDVVQVTPEEAETKRALKRWLSQYVRSNYDQMVEYLDKEDGSFLVRKSK